MKTCIATKCHQSFIKVWSLLSIQVDNLKVCSMVAHVQYCLSTGLVNIEYSRLFVQYKYTVFADCIRHCNLQMTGIKQSIDHKKHVRLQFLVFFISWDNVAAMCKIHTTPIQRVIILQMTFHINEIIRCVVKSTHG